MFVVLIGITLLMIVIFRGITPIIGATTVAALIVLFSGIDFTDGMINTYAGGFANMVKALAFMLIWGNVFGEMLVKTKSAETIAEWIAKLFGVKHCTWALMIISGILAAGGMSYGGYIVTYHIGIVLCSRANYSKNIVIGAIFSGAWTFATLGPGMPSPQNALLQANLGTASTAGLIPGLAACVAIFIANGIYMERQCISWQNKGIVFSAGDGLPVKDGSADEKRPHIIAAILPIVLVLVLYNFAKLNVAVSVLMGAISCFILNIRRFSLKEWLKLINDGALSCALPLMNVSVMGGFGAVVALTAFYGDCLDALSAIDINPYILCILSGNLFAGIMGSSTNGITLSMSAINPLLFRYAEQGYDIGNMHRLLALSSGGLDSLPHSPTFNSVCTLFHTTPKESYRPVFFTCTIIPILASILIALPLAMLGLT